MLLALRISWKRMEVRTKVHTDQIGLRIHGFLYSDQAMDRMSNRLTNTDREGQATNERVGSPGRIRTAGQAINSRLLYR